MKFAISFFLVCFLQYGNKTGAQKTDTLSGNRSDTHNMLLNETRSYRDEIMSELESFQNSQFLPNQMHQQLKELTGILHIVNETQNAQKEKFMKFSRSIEQTKLSLFKMLSEYENRIDQLEYDIMKYKTYDPYVEQYKYPINKYWIKVDLSKGKSYWKFEKTKDFISIKQKNDLSNLNKPSTILILKHHKIIEGFISADILTQSAVTSKVHHSAAGIVFHFTNAQNFRFVELSFVDDQAVIVIGEVVADVFKRILLKNVEAHYSNFNTLTCKFENTQISIYLNYEKVIELNDSEESVKNVIGLFTRIGTANFKNIISGNDEYEKELEHKLQTSNPNMVSKVTLSNSFRFAVKNNTLDDLSVYEIPHELGDYDMFDESKHIDDVYPVPPSDSYYDEEKTFTLQDFQKYTGKKEQEQHACKEYSKKEFDLQEWVNSNSQYNWKVINEYGIERVVVQTGIKTAIYKSALIYKNSTCNSAIYSVNVKLEYDSEAGLLFRHDDKENMYIVTISTKTKDVVLKKINSDMKTILKAETIKNINSFQRHVLHINDDGQKGKITVFLDNQQIFSVNDELYYKSGSVGLYVETGFATFDTFHIAKINNISSN